MNYMADSTVAATAENDWIRAQQARPFQDPTCDPRRALGTDANWRQRRLYEWAFLATSFSYAGNEEKAQYCWQRAAEYRA
jgi:hypothetical protein